LISIITPSLNNCGDLQATCASVDGQNFTNFEHLIIDGESNDGTVKYLQSHSKDFRSYITEKDSGVYDAMNKGIRMAKGAYIIFLNAGDVFPSENTLEIIGQNTTNYPGYDLFYGNAIYTNGLKKENKIYHLNKVSLFKQMICHQVIICKKELFDNYGLFDLSYKIKSDYEWLARMLFNKIRIRRIDKVIVVYQQGGLSDQYYNTWSVKEIPQIRNKYYSRNVQRLLRRFVFHGSITNTLFYPAYYRLAQKTLSPII
jgi:glycosyltransferase involved in cell wall biosynthesis